MSYALHCPRHNRRLRWDREANSWFCPNAGCKEGVTDEDHKAIIEAASNNKLDALPSYYLPTALPTKE